MKKLLITVKTRVLMSKLDRNSAFTIFLTFLIFALFLIYLNLSTSTLVQKPVNIKFNTTTNTLNLSTMTLRQKIAQMFVAYAKVDSREFLQDMVVGGVHVTAQS